MMNYTIQLPAPPSDNERLVLSAGGKRALSGKYRNWRDMAALLMRTRAKAIGWQTATVDCTVHALIQIGKNRDIQNCAKAMCDAMTLGEIYKDDNLIQRITIERAGKNSTLPKGEMLLTVSIHNNA